MGETWFLVLLGAAAVYWIFRDSSGGSGGNDVSLVNTATSPPSSYQPVASSSESRLVGVDFHPNEIKRTGFIVLDTETTGLVNRSPRHRAFNICLVNVRFDADAKKWFYNPFDYFTYPDTSGMKGLKMSDQWTQYLARRDHAKEWRLESLLPKIQDNIRDRPIVAHNVNFDRAVLSNEFEKCGIAFPFANHDWHCTLKIARANQFGRYTGSANPYRGPYSYRLSDVAEHFELEFDDNQWHTAQYDALVTMRIFLKILSLAGTR